MKSLIKLVIVSLSLSVCLSAFSANTISKVTYKWTDDKGIVQYTERPPKNHGYEKITISASGSEEITNVTQEEATEKETTNNSTADDYAKANLRNCEIAKRNLNVLTNLARIRVSDEKGENRILSDEEKKAREDETRKEIKVYCTETPKT
ncbi:MAG: hypothetical protein COA74_13085 [Gammaproteobacteria bacterium]|nr:MAG: hypothetical protein COA74_13085 [Gammaproteobacteria bacterium]